MSELPALTTQKLDGDLHLPLQPDATDNDLEVRFWPPLFEQRRGWVLDVLRREGVTSVIDIGCGEGSLLQCLCNPAMYALSPSAALSDVSKNIFDPQNHPSAGYLPELHIRNLVGLDISDADLRNAIEATALTSTSMSSYYTHPRWEPLDVKVWKGRFEVYNESFVNAECIVCMEVIEHLDPSTLAIFAPILLGVYRPRLFLVTTPSYTYNARMRPPGFTLSTRFLDPTGRTERVFRHSDHKFEWTVEEFKEWCEVTAAIWAYEVVHLGGVGRAEKPDPWGRDATLGLASQVVCFRRRDDVLPEVSRLRELSLLRESNLQQDAYARHDLLVHHHHPAHPLAGRPSASDEIQKSVIATLSCAPLSELDWTVQDVWVHHGIAELCGGYVDCLLGAITDSENLNLEASSEGSFLNWRVTIIRGAAQLTSDNVYDDNNMEVMAMNVEEQTLVTAMDEMDVSDTEGGFLASMAEVDSEEFDTWTVATRGSWDDPLGADGWEEATTDWGTSSLMTSSLEESMVDTNAHRNSRLGWTEASIISWSKDGEGKGHPKWGESSTAGAMWNGLEDEEPDQDATWSDSATQGTGMGEIVA